MSLMGQKAKFRADHRTSAFASKADIPSLMARTVSRQRRDARALAMVPVALPVRLLRLFQK
jgi:hypothetical protein